MERTVCILGSGNVASHLKQWLTEICVNSCACSSKTPDEWPDAKIYLLAVKDSAIREVAQELRQKNAIVVHLSGSTSIDALESCPQRGVIYPVQTFTKGVSLNYTEIPLLVEGSTSEIEDKLWQLAGAMSDFRRRANSEERRQVHLAGVCASNFTNHLMLLAQKQLAKSGISLDILRSLMEETLNKAFINGPLAAQTGPARRNDQITIGKHLEMLTEEPRLQEIYRLISSSIKDTYNQ